MEGDRAERLTNLGEVGVFGKGRVGEVGLCGALVKVGVVVAMVVEDRGSCVGVAV